MTISCQPGDALFFWGEGFLSWAIRFFTKGPSHCAIILDPKFVTDDGAGLGGPYIAESTIERGIDGVQVNSLPVRIANYDKGGAIAIARLDSRIRGVLDFPAMWDFFYKKVNRDKYEKVELLGYLARYIPLIEWLPQYDNPNQEVCSELVAQLMAVGGLPGLNPFRCPPRSLYEMKIYSSIEWLYGTPRNLGKFNTK